MAFNEVKECCQGHQDLTERLHGESLNYIGKRHAMRIMSDAYGKGIVRGQAENTNLRAYSIEGGAVTLAESFRTCQTEAFLGREYVDMIEKNERSRARASADSFRRGRRTDPVEEKSHFSRRSSIVRGATASG
jgi:hypothetical protein